MFIWLWKKIHAKYLKKIRYPAITKALKPYLNGHSKILDVGCASGKLTKHLFADSYAEITGIDVVIPKETHINVVKYDGQKFPFVDDSFDLVLMIDILHHDHNIENIINEAKRVSRKGILIKDHYWEQKYDFWILSLYDYLGNKPFGIPLAYNFQTIESWKKILNSLELNIVEMKKLRQNKLELRKSVIFYVELS